MIYIKKILLITVGILLTVSLLIISLFVLSPKPTAMLIYKVFEGGVAVEPAHYNELLNEVTIKENLSYPSVYKENDYDLITPNKSEQPLPVIFWVHGGAFLGGDKRDVLEYGVQIAHEGYAVVNLNYELAPSSKYPGPLVQLEEVYTHIKGLAEKHNLDMNEVYFAGDSAGAQIASQFVNVQVDKLYAERIDLTQSVPSESIKGALLFCGPYDISRFSSLSDNAVFSFILDRVGWAYIGDRDWQNSQAVKDASIIDHVSDSFPASFITDGNMDSFEEQAKSLVKKLEASDVFVEGIFYPLADAELGHEYQFMMDKKESQQTLDSLIVFLNNKQK